MPQAYQTPGVYIVEQNAFPDSVVEVATAIPAFIGYTAKAAYKGKNLAKLPTKVESLKQFVDFFGAGFTQTFDLTVPASATVPASTPVTPGTISAGTFTGGTISAVDNSTTPPTATITGATITGATVSNAAVAGTISGASIDNAVLSGGTPAVGLIASGTIISGGQLTAGTTPPTTAPASPTGAISGANGTVSAGTLAGATATGADTTGTLTNATLNNVTIAGQLVAGPITGVTVNNATLTGTVANGPIATSTPITGGTVVAPAPASSNAAGVSPISLTFPSGQTASLTLYERSPFYLYNAIRMFYMNGGSTCYIISIGGYTDTTNHVNTAKPGDFTDAIDTLEAEQDPTMLLCPDALMLGSADYYTVMTHMLDHCQNVQKRVALFDVFGDVATSATASIPPPSIPPTLTDTDSFRNNIGTKSLNYGIAYFPWVNASIVSVTDVSFLNLTAASMDALAGLLPSIPSTKPGGSSTPSPLTKQFTAAKTTLTANTAGLATLDATNLPTHNSLLAGSPEYGLTLRAITDFLNVQPVAPAMAGVITGVDNTRGVWKAPANVSLNAVVAPNVLVSDQDQGNLNVDAVTGKSINVIRSFKGLGTLVWGARTLDGNSQDWRYINVRRTMIMIEQSIKLAARNTVFEPNDANTWTTFKSMLNSFLFNLWKQGALFGTKPDDAYQVLVGLGSTMTADDVLDGIMNVTVLVALVRPAEFIVVTFKQQMQQAA